MQFSTSEEALGQAWGGPKLGFLKIWGCPFEGPGVFSVSKWEAGLRKYWADLEGGGEAMTRVGPWLRRQYLRNILSQSLNLQSSST